MTDVLFNTPVLSESALIELDSETNRPGQDPCNCHSFLIRCSPPSCGFMSEGDPGPPGSLSAVIMGEQYVTQYRVC